MNKAELVKRMAEIAEVPKAAAEKLLDAFMKAVEEAISKGDKVVLVGFGSFQVTKRAAREGRNPRTGKPIKIPAKKVVKFKPGKKLEEAAKKS
ncbi:MAG: HU family DNA-binding protein [Thermodesulfobacterium sp.]|uniref:Bacterial nucleoid DNA-binding protein IHF-alpha n=1 Tax=Candidatus Thermodesulfobacterium syntrophicum TaxID=3060442 RepID=A0AAE3TFV5_9BACT|nr:HU family DNA-binding protein [Thermodesulfobacterium sp.]MDF2953638.1 Bacterial nucleoid DNA-binding protein IHF-alpha [Candidatus Thermodesulfobacterium syntrophicum]